MCRNAGCVVKVGMATESAEIQCVSEYKVCRTVVTVQLMPHSHDNKTATYPSIIKYGNGNSSQMLGTIKTSY